MPEFTNAFSGLKENRKLTHGELVRAIRFMIAAEYEAIQLYTQLAASIDDKLAQEVLWDISNEEKEHAGEFLRLLQVLAPDEQGFYDEGMGETNEKIDKLNQADSMIFTTENQLKELGDKLPADKKAPIEAALQKLKDAHKSQDLAAIDTAMAEINTVFQAASAEMYAQGGTQGGAQAGPDMNAGQNAGQDSSKHGDNVQDADFEEVK